MLDSDESSPTKKGYQSASEIVDSHLQYLGKFKWSINDNNKNLPIIYAILKLPKQI